MADKTANPHPLCDLAPARVNTIGDVMIDDEHRPRHWLYTLLLALGAVVIILACVILLPFLIVELNSGTFLSFPFGYYLAAQGVMIGLIVLVYWMAIRQEETDQKFGATEDL